MSLVRHISTLNVLLVSLFTLIIYIMLKNTSITLQLNNKTLKLTSLYDTLDYELC